MHWRISIRLIVALVFAAVIYGVYSWLKPPARPFDQGVVPVYIYPSP